MVDNTRKVIGSIGMPQSGTHMLKNVLGGVLNNHLEYSFRLFSHAKAGYVNVMPIKRCENLHLVFFYYRNQIDRVMKTIVRMHTKDRKAGQPSAKLQIDDYKEFISAKVQEVLSNKEHLITMRDRYVSILENRDRVVEACEERGVICLPVAYEHIYDNFDFIYNHLNQNGIKLKESDKARVNKGLSSEAVYHVCRQPKQLSFLANHVSHSRGEPFYWAKMFDFKGFYQSLSEEHQSLIRELVINHTHKNLPGI